MPSLFFNNKILNIIMDEIISKINGIQEEFVCEKCGHKQQINIFPYINFKENPEYYSKVKDLSIFNIICNKCHQQSTIQYNILLLDEVHKYFLYLLPNKEDYDHFKHQIEYFMKINFNEDEIPEYKEYKTRLVFDLNDLIEKMTIFEISLNDKAIEILKNAIIDSKCIEDSTYKLYFDRIDGLDFVFIYLVKLTNQVKDIKLNVGLYNGIIEKINHETELRKFEIIDSEWARNFVKSDK